MAEWKAIDELFDYEKGTLQSSKCTPGKYPFITAAEEWKTHETFTHDCEALIFAMAASGSLGRTHYINGKFISSDLCFILTPKTGLRLDLTFYYRLFNFLRSGIVKKTATGTSKLAINQTNFGAYKLPYFDYEHQLSFRGKIETITGINEEFSEGMDYQLSLLIKLRQAVLQEAVEGKLTAEWRKKNQDLISGENHASKLLEKIKAEKERLIKEGKIKKDKSLSPITDEEKPFALPEGWVWCRLGEITELITSGSRDWAKFYRNNGRAKFIRMGNLSHTWFDLKCEKIQQVEPPTSGEGTRTSLIADDLLISITGDVGWKALIPENLGEAYINQHTALIRFIDTLRGRFFPVILCSPLANKQFNEPQRGIKNSFRLTDLSSHIVPFSPFAEQQAIVERVEKLMVMIGELEKQVAERKDQSEMLMQSVLREAFVE